MHVAGDRNFLSAPDVSVIMPVGGIDEALRGALKKLDEQTPPFSWELVIGLNTDDSDAQSLLESLLSVRSLNARIIDASTKRSASFARNTAAAAARSSRLVFCDGDDEAEPNWLEEIVAAHEPGTAIGGHLAEDRLIVEGQEDWRPPATPGCLPSFLDAPYLVSANMAVWADDFASVGGFDEGLIRGEDIDFAWKLSEIGVDLRYCPTAVIHYRHRAGLRSLLQQHYLYGRGMAQVLARREPPGTENGGKSRMLKANGQKVENQSGIHVLRRGAIAAGRLRGLLDS